MVMITTGDANKPREVLWGRPETNNHTLMAIICCDADCVFGHKHKII